jgi:hypothetical protein
VLYGVRPGPPGFGPGRPTAFPPDGLAGCAPTGAENASAATTATPFKRCFVVIRSPPLSKFGKDITLSSAPITR